MIHHGDLFDVLPTLDAESIDACVTDGPYGIGFMGKKWDTFRPGVEATRIVPNRQIESDNPNLKGRTRGPASSPSAVEYDYSIKGLREFQAFTELWGREVYRVLKPGAYVVSCGAPRSHHRMMCGLEDAGFVVRDCFAWLFGQGFPKSLNLGDGKGTALKPAHEPIALAWKPFKGSITACHERYGTAALNIDACRIEGDVPKPGGLIRGRRARFDGAHDSAATELPPEPNPFGRWPANVLLDEEAAAMLDEQSGELISGERSKLAGQAFGGGWRDAEGRTDPAIRTVDTYFNASSGGASRFYYVAKPSREERDFGCQHLTGRSSFETVSRDPSSVGANNPRAGAGRLSLLNTGEIVYPSALWVDAVLSRRLQADTETSRRKAIAGSTIQCSDGSVWSMCWCGSPSTDPYHPALMSIIETETNFTTTSTISNSSQRPHTNGCMAAAFGVRAAGGNLAAYAEFQSPWKRFTGISRKRAGPSTDDVSLATSVASWLISKPENGGGRRVEAARNFHPT